MMIWHRVLLSSVHVSKYAGMTRFISIAVKPEKNSLSEMKVLKKRFFEPGNHWENRNVYDKICSY